MKNQVAEQTLFGHPKGLFYLFFAELWERFSFYGMRALLMLYMTQYLMYDDKMSFGIFAAYGSLVYVTPLIGGIVADKILGYKKSIILGGILMAAGHFILTIEHPITFYSALALLIVGNGFFKPNISSFVGSLYQKGDERRDSGFMIFYMGVNIGGWIAPLLCGWLGITYGWHYGFGLAGIGMLFGLFVFNRAIKKGVFGKKGEVANKKLYEQRFAGIKTGQLVTIGAILMIPIMALIVKFNEFEHYLVWLVSFGIITILFVIFKQATKTERGQLGVLIYFTILACLFFIVFEQAGSSLTLFAERNVDLRGINASQSNSLNSFYIILLAIPFTWLWTYLSRTHKNPSSPFKMGLGLVLVGLGFLTFGYSSNYMNDTAQVPMLFLIAGIFIYTLGELFLSPIGLSKVTELSPKKFISFLMGVWFLASFYGHFFAGKIAQLTTIVEGEESIFTKGIFANLTPKITGLDYQEIQSMGEAHLQLYSYVSVFTGIGLVTFFIGLLAILIVPFIKKFMGGVK
ncbi:MAG TPA: MFS transporter [Crocinitomicaceae bacterium]|nr:MFS transporter [Crocinitomicaceae bacterium]